jgi:hypothetical protein
MGISHLQHDTTIVSPRHTPDKKTAHYGTTSASTTSTSTATAGGALTAPTSNGMTRLEIESGGKASVSVVTDNSNEDDEPVSVVEQLNDIWETVQLRAVWRPMAFVYVFNILQIPNVAWQSFLQLTLHFEPWILVSI